MKKETWHVVRFVHPDTGATVEYSSRARCPVCGQSPCRKNYVCIAAKKTGTWTTRVLVTGQ